jgi:hypothetical protein
MIRIVLASILILASQQPSHAVQGAVRTVDVRGRALEVTTGVGMALRVVRVQVPADVHVTSAGAPLPFAQLQAGDIVRMSYGSRPGGYVAYNIERLERTP